MISRKRATTGATSAAAYPIQNASVERSSSHALPRHHLRLPIERLMIGEPRDRHVCDHGFSRDAAFNQPRRCRLLARRCLHRPGRRISVGG